MLLAEEITHKVLAELNSKKAYNFLWNGLGKDSQKDVETSITKVVQTCIDNALQTKSLVSTASLLTKISK